MLHLWYRARGVVLRKLTLRKRSARHLQNKFGVEKSTESGRPVGLAVTFERYLLELVLVFEPRVSRTFEYNFAKQKYKTETESTAESA